MQERQLGFLVWPGNNSDVVRRQLLRRPHWTDVAGSLERADGESDPAWRQRVAQRNERVRAAFDSQRFHLCWRPTLRVKVNGAGQSVTLHSPPLPEGQAQLVNHFPALKGLVTKTGLVRSLRRYYTLLSDTHVFDVTPTTFVVRNEEGNDEWQRFVQHFSALAHDPAAVPDERMPAKHCAANLWLVKPAASNQGRGIQVLAELSRIKTFLFTQPTTTEWVLQKYIERPLLFFGRKFDIRVWVLAVGAGAGDADLDVYMYRDGYLRTSSERFSTDLRRGAGDKGDQASLVHLTNFCMQKHGPNIGRFEDGNTVSYAQFQEYLDAEHAADGVDFRADVLPRLEALVLDALLAVRPTLGAAGAPRRCFELFGYDFMLDEDYRPYLIEVNTNPYLGEQNEWHGRLVERMAADMVALAVDPVFPPPVPVETVETPTEANGFQLLYSRGRDDLPLKVRRVARGGPVEEVREDRGAAWLYPKGGPLRGDDPLRRMETPFDKAAAEARRRVIAYRRALDCASAPPTTDEPLSPTLPRWGAPRKPPVPKLALTESPIARRPAPPPAAALPESSNQQQAPDEPPSPRSRLAWATDLLIEGVRALSRPGTAADEEGEEPRAPNSARAPTPTPPTPTSTAWAVASASATPPAPTRTLRRATVTADFRPIEDQPRQQQRLGTALRTLLRCVKERPTSVGALAAQGALPRLWTLVTHAQAKPRHAQLAAALLDAVLQNPRAIELRAPVPLPDARALVAACVPLAVADVVLSAASAADPDGGGVAPVGGSAGAPPPLAERAAALQLAALQLLTYGVRWGDASVAGSAAAAAALHCTAVGAPAARRAARVLLGCTGARELAAASAPGAEREWPAHLQASPAFRRAVAVAVDGEVLARAANRRRREERAAAAETEAARARGDEARRRRAAEWAAEQERAAAKRRERHQAKRQAQERERAAAEAAKAAADDELRRQRMAALEAKLREQKRRKREADRARRAQEEAEARQAEEDLRQRQAVAQAMRLQWLRRKLNEKRERERAAAEREAEAHQQDEEERLRRIEYTQHRIRKREMRESKRRGRRVRGAGSGRRGSGSTVGAAGGGTVLSLPSLAEFASQLAMHR